MDKDNMVSDDQVHGGSGQLTPSSTTPPPPPLPPPTTFFDPNLFNFDQNFPYSVQFQQFLSQFQPNPAQFQPNPVQFQPEFINLDPFLFRYKWIKITKPSGTCTNT
ncbi:hypothetical protein LIER_25339 [Lithospermum erythrorhizon]|uniref:Uncharacterized protein n=1 Tax=Lithospermum erythrorhizon TaxID=34254 RepID=A0AAV3R5Y0_LITER